MDPPTTIPPGSPTALQPVSSDRVNQQPARESTMHLRKDSSNNVRDSIVVDKINQFNSLAVQSKQLERKTADAALKRAMLGREEAETEMRRYKEEARALRKQVEEGKERERRVGERLETVMENYGRAKETHAHTQALWEKEIRRARKETFKSQSMIVKLQEELKSARTAVKSAEELLDVEKERSKAREQEAFTSRYNLVGVQEQLEQSLERVKMLEQERDAFKALAKNEEDIAKLAAEGRLPLPPSSGPDAEDDEFASPRKTARVSIGLEDIKSSASTEAELDELTMLWQWEKHRAERALEQVEFLQAECELKCCSCAKIHRREIAAATAASSPHRQKRDTVQITDPSDLAVLSEDAHATKSDSQMPPPPKRSKTEMLRASKGPRLSTIFVPTEGIFRTVSQEEAEAMEAVQQTEPQVDTTLVEEESAAEPPTPDRNPPYYARTPSVEPPDFAMIAKQQRTSLLSLLNAPHGHHSHDAPLLFNIPTTPGPGRTTTRTPSQPPSPEPTATETETEETEDDNTLTQQRTLISTPATLPPTNPPSPSHSPQPCSHTETDTRPHTAAAFYHSSISTTTTTTKVPLKNEPEDDQPSLSQRLLAAQRTPQKAGFDPTNHAFTPTMTREQALAQIRERRARVVTPRKQMVEGVLVERRDVSAPTGRVGGVVTPGRRVRS